MNFVVHVTMNQISLNKQLASSRHIGGKRGVHLMRPGIGRNTSCALGDCLTSRPKGHSQPGELWFSIYSCT